MAQRDESGRKFFSWRGEACLTPGLECSLQRVYTPACWSARFSELCPERLRARLRLRLRAVGRAASIDLNHRLAHALDLFRVPNRIFPVYSGISVVHCIFSQPRNTRKRERSLKPLIFAHPFRKAEDCLTTGLECSLQRV